MAFDILVLLYLFISLLISIYLQPYQPHNIIIYQAITNYSTNYHDNLFDKYYELMIELPVIICKNMKIRISSAENRTFLMTFYVNI